MNQSLASKPADLPANQSLDSKPVDLSVNQPLLEAAGSPANQQYLADSLPPPTVIASLLNCLLTPVSQNKDTGGLFISFLNILLCR